ncbi:Limbic system-associated membrane protein [Dissostichus eleginoides]|uniref:Limbic system-associated membrane protein n=1 Tax=Dissostichus eleginoides TaxID=100907 RepID=A0AAD9CEE8_DISEL|nr:Limbic system-associated membrane protein [Dissostichus eleginoides]
MQVGRKSCWRQLQASLFRLLCLIPTGFPVRSVDMQRANDNITIRQGDTAIISINGIDSGIAVLWVNYLHSDDTLCLACYFQGRLLCTSALPQWILINTRTLPLI